MQTQRIKKHKNGHQEDGEAAGSVGFSAGMEEAAMNEENGDEEEDEEEDSDFDPDLNDVSSTGGSDAQEGGRYTSQDALGGPFRALDGYSVHMPKTRKLFHMYSSPAVGSGAARGDVTEDSAGRHRAGAAHTGATSSSAEPLILDVGVSLPKDDQEGSPAGYRHQWRNYFR